jgi:hypothetical protein
MRKRSDTVKICVFEWESVCGTEISPESLSRFGELALYGKPDPSEVETLVGDAEIVLCSKVPFPKERLMRVPHATECIEAKEARK